MRGKLGDTQRDKTLAAVRSEIHDDKIEIGWLRLPLDDDEVLVRGIVLPGGLRLEKLGLALSHSAVRQFRQQLGVNPFAFRVHGFGHVTDELDWNLAPRAIKLTFMQKAHSGQPEDNQGRGAMLGG